MLPYSVCGDVISTGNWATPKCPLGFLFYFHLFPLSSILTNLQPGGWNISAIMRCSLKKNWTNLWTRFEWNKPLWYFHLVRTGQTTKTGSTEWWQSKISMSNKERTKMKQWYTETQNHDKSKWNCLCHIYTVYILGLILEVILQYKSAPTTQQSVSLMWVWPNWLWMWRAEEE